MEHLTYEDYQKFGGRVDDSLFPLLLLDAEVIVNKLTFNRIEELKPTYKRMMVEIIDKILKPKSDFKSGITSYSNGVESISYNTEDFTDASTMRKIKQICSVYLDDGLMYRGIGK